MNHLTLLSIASCIPTVGRYPNARFAFSQLNILVIQLYRTPNLLQFDSFFPPLSIQTAHSAMNAINIPSHLGITLMSSFFTSYPACFATSLVKSQNSQGSSLVIINASPSTLSAISSGCDDARSNALAARRCALPACEECP